jgi:2-polyprenyl-3-methyl-5-hydroxy-6-metoxy-1,4-benzoquinol methylase
MMSMYGSEKAPAESDWRRRLGYHLLGELHIPGRLRVRHVIRELKRTGSWNQSRARLLDAGGGEGAFAYHVARRFPSWSVVVADNETRTLERGQRIQAALGLRNLEVRDTDLLALDGHDQFDVVICSDVLEHIQDDQRVVTNLAGVLKPGGLLIVTSPSVPQPKHLSLVAWRERRIGFSPEDYGHVRQGYSEADLERLFGTAGLKTERIRRTFGPCGTLMFDLFFVTGDSRPNPLVYAALFPVYMALSALDMVLPYKDGAAILGSARKP